MMSKKRLDELCNMVSPFLANQNEGFIAAIQYPWKKHTESRGRATIAWRERKAAELGITTSEFCKQLRLNTLKAKLDK